MSKKLFKKLMELNRVRLIEKPAKAEKSENTSNKPKRNKEGKKVVNKKFV